MFFVVALKKKMCVTSNAFFGGRCLEAHFSSGRFVIRIQLDGHIYSNIVISVLLYLSNQCCFTVN